MGGEELNFIREAFASNYIAPLGPMVDAFEREFAAYTGIPHCLALVSGTAAMHLALRELGVGPGDEVLASSLTFIGSVTPVTFLGASLVFLDSDRATWNLDPALLAEELAACASRGKLPKAVIPTDLYGQCADLNAIKAICEPYGIPVVADAAEAMGARYGGKPEDRGQRTEDRGCVTPHELRPPSTLNPQPSTMLHAGYGAKAAVFSFNGNKIITTSGGGMLASHDKGLIEHARKLSQQAREPAPHYEHTEIGYNYRMSNVVAAIGRGQLRVLDQRVRRKRQIFETYQRLLADLPGIEFMPEAPTGRCNRWLTVILIDPAHFGATNEQVRLALEAENIESRPVWKPMHLQPVFRGCRVRGGQVSEQLFQQGLCLPSGTAMTDSDLERVAGIIRDQGKSRK
jgi:dTDP-4-amino-4,6-dideoxygalactose transaminase